MYICVFAHMCICVCASLTCISALFFLLLGISLLFYSVIDIKPRLLCMVDKPYSLSSVPRPFSIPVNRVIQLQ